MRTVGRRLGFFVVTFWAAVTLNFVIPRLMPGSPAESLLAQYPHVQPQALHALTTLLGGGHQQSLAAQYANYWKQGLHVQLRHLVHDELRHAGADDGARALPWTLGLVGVTTIVAFVLGTFIGLVSAWRTRRLARRDAAAEPR